MRNLFYQTHLYLGIISSIILFIICMTGSILVFEDESIDFFDRSYLYSKTEGTQEISLEKKIAKVEKATGKRVSAMMLFGDPNHNYSFLLADRKETDTNGKQKKLEKVWVNSHNGNLIQQSETGSAERFFSWITRLHRWLLLDSKTGRAITGVATVIFIFLSLSGIVLYVPAKRIKWFRYSTWLPHLTLKKSTRIPLILHRNYSFYALIPLFLISLSALIWSYPSYYSALEKLLGDQLGKQRFDKTITTNEFPGKNAYMLPLKMLIAKADSILPYTAKVYRIDLPETTAESIMIRKKSSSFFAYDAADKVQLNPYTGSILEVDRFRDWSFNSKIAGLIRSIHVGSFIGISSKIIYFLAALIASSLPVTGLIMWSKQLKTKRKRKPIKLR